MQYWMVKQEPESYSWADFVADGRTCWTGVRNYQARIHLRGMKVGDFVLFYHSVSEKAVVGIARVIREAYPDPTAEQGDWVCVDLVPLKPLLEPVKLEQFRSDPILSGTALVKISRLSVLPFTQPQFLQALKLGRTPPPNP